MPAPCAAPVYYHYRVFSIFFFVRNALVSGWMRDVDAQELPTTEGFSFTGFLAKPTDVRAWNIQVGAPFVIYQRALDGYQGSIHMPTTPVSLFGGDR